MNYIDFKLWQIFIIALIGSYLSYSFYDTVKYGLYFDIGIIIILIILKIIINQFKYKPINFQKTTRINFKENEIETEENNKQTIITSVEELKNYDREQPNTETTTHLAENRVMPNKVLNDEEEENIIFINAEYKLPPLNLIENSPDFIDGICSLKNSFDIFLGKQSNEEYLIANITKFPNLIIGGTVMSGKSMLVHNIICNLLMTTKPNELKFMIIDSKKVELSNYNGVPHLLCPVVTDPKKSSLSLQKIVAEMEKRHDLLYEKGIKNIGSYNDWVEEQYRTNPSSPIPKMYYILVVIDELADLMLVASKEVEESIMRITQMGHQFGIHLITTLSNASSKEMSSTIKSYFPTRIAFKTTSKVDSRLILDEIGAEQLNEIGSCLYKGYDTSKAIKIKTSILDEKDINRITSYVCKEQQVKYNESLTSYLKDSHIARSLSEPEEYDDPLYNEVVEFAAKTGKINASLLQRRFRLGYNRAARIVDLLEERGIIGPQNGSKPREVLIKLENIK